MIKYLILLLACFLLACNSNETLDVPITEVKQGLFTEELTEEGSIQSVNALLISSPRLSYRFGRNLKIAFILEDGADTFIQRSLRHGCR